MEKINAPSENTQAGTATAGESQVKLKSRFKPLAMNAFGGSINFCGNKTFASVKAIKDAIRAGKLVAPAGYGITWEEIVYTD